MYKNYKLIKEQELKDINSYGELLSHEKTGARVLLLKNDDENKSFCIGFRTPPYDDTGLPHILEHSVLCGSRKFPVKEPFVELMKSSLNTFLNAMTFPDKTIYPVASCHDKDFKNLMDVYMDAVLYPNIHSKEEIFKQEGWHYELDSKDGELIYNGVVYNEMKGAFSSPDGILGRESLNSLFPDTAYGVESGGNPDYIPTLTYEKFKEFHKKYYHPSNSYIVLYGNCNMEETLQWLDDEYLSKFDKINVNSQLEIQKPFDKINEKTVLYPVSKEQGTENKTLLSYNVALNDKVPAEDLMAMEVLTQVLLQSAAAPLKKALLDDKIGDVIVGEFDSGILQPVFSIVTKNTNPEEKDRFVAKIEGCLNEFVEKGINKKSLEAAINNYEFKLREADFGGASKGIIYTINSLSTWLYDDNDPFSMFDFTPIFNKLKQNIETDYYEKIIEKYLLNNTHKSIVIAQPSLDIQENKETALKEKLAQYKNSLSEEEVLQIVESTKLLKEYQAKPDTKEDLDTIPLLKKSDLSSDVLPLSNNISTMNNVKVLWHNVPTNGIAYIRFLFNIKDLPSNLVSYLGVFKTLFASLDTQEHQYETLEQDIMINSGGIKTSVLCPVSNVGYTPYFMIEASSLFDKINFVLNIVNEVISSTNYDMKNRIKECLTMSLNATQQSLIGAGHVKSLTRALSYNEPNYYYNDVVNGIAYFDLLSEILKDYDKQYEQLIKNLQELSKYMYCKENLILSFTGTEDGYKLFDENVNNFINCLNNKEAVNDVFEFVANQKNEGFKAPIDVQYVALTGNFKKMGLPYTGALKVFENAVSTDYLWKNVRVLGGAYGCMCGFNYDGTAYFTSYRDPNLEKTLETYKGVVNYLKEFSATDEEMVKYIIGAVGNYDFPKSPSNKGLRSLVAYLSNKTEDDYKFEKFQIITTKESDIKGLVAYVDALVIQNNICVIGNDKKIEEGKNLFKDVKPLLK